MNSGKAAQLMPSVWCLRLLSGAMGGRTIGLKLGANVAGSAGDCTVMLTDPEALPRHLLFQVGAVAVSLQKLGVADACVNGQAMSLQRRAIVAGDIISVGALEFQLDRVATQTAHVVHESADSVLVAWDSLAEPPQVRATSPRPRRASTLFVAIAGITLAIGTAVWWSDSGDATAATGTPPAGNVNLTDLANAVAGFPGVEFTVGALGQVRISGHVESEARKLALRDALKKYGERVTVKVLATQEIVEQVLRYLSDPAIFVSNGGPGRLVLSGTVAEEPVRLKVRRLQEDMRPLVTIVDQLRYEVITAAEPAPAARAGATAGTTAERAVFRARVVGVTQDSHGMRHIQLANGARYYEGSILESGAELKGIDMNGMHIITNQTRPQGNVVGGE